MLRRTRQVEAAVALTAAETPRRRRHSPYRPRRERIPLVAIEVSIERRSGGGHRPLERRYRLDGVVERDRSGVARERFGEPCRVRAIRANRATICGLVSFDPHLDRVLVEHRHRHLRLERAHAGVRPSIRRVVRHIGQRHGAARMHAAGRPECMRATVREARFCWWHVRTRTFRCPKTACRRTAFGRGRPSPPSSRCRRGPWGLAVQARAATGIGWSGGGSCLGSADRGGEEEGAAREHAAPQNTIATRMPRRRIKASPSRSGREAPVYQPA